MTGQGCEPDVGHCVRGALTALAVFAMATAPGCMPDAPARAAGLKTPEFAPEGQSKCKVSQSQSQPLIVEWPSAERAALESGAHHGLVVVRYSGCEMELLRCQATSKYGYTPITRKFDRVTLKDDDELYANMPIGAAKLEGKLHASGQLNIAMTIVGRFEAERATVRKDELTGDCERATHVIAALTVGAFEFFAGASSDVEVGAAGLGAKVGGASAATKELLSRDGDDARCASSAGSDKSPPEGCGAFLRVEVVPLGDAKAREPVCPDGTQWDGSACVRRHIVASVECPAGSAWSGSACVAAGPARAMLAQNPRPPTAAPSTKASLQAPPAPAPAPAPALVTAPVTAGPRFTIAGDTARDSRSGLTWQRQHGPKKITWDVARQRCAALGSGWRLPTSRELETVSSVAAGSEEDVLSRANDYLWSSTQETRGSLRAIAVRTSDGSTKNAFTDFEELARCVQSTD